MDSVNLSNKTSNYFHLTTYPNPNEKNGLKKIALSALKFVSYLTGIVPLIMLAIHHRATIVALNGRAKYELPLSKNYPKIQSIINRTLPDKKPGAAFENKPIPPKPEPQNPKIPPKEFQKPPVPPKPEPLISPFTILGTNEASTSTTHGPTTSSTAGSAANSLFGSSASLSGSGIINPNGSATAPVSTIDDKAAELRAIEDEFQNAISNDETFNHFEALFLNKEDYTESIDWAVEAFIGLRNPALPPWNQKQIDYLRKIIVTQADAILNPNPKVLDLNIFPRPIFAHPEVSLLTFLTKGDGSCGIHAVMGEYNEETSQYSCEAEFHRYEFCNWLEELRATRNIPVVIQGVIDDFLENPVKAPSFLQKNPVFIEAADRITNLKAELLPLRQQRQADLIINPRSPINPKLAELETAYINLKDQLIHDERVFKAYTDILRQVGQYLLPEEIAAFAEFKGKTLLLFEKVNDEGDLTCTQILANGVLQPIDDFTQRPENSVCVYFITGRHYEKADIQFNETF